MLYLVAVVIALVLILFFLVPTFLAGSALFGMSSNAGEESRLTQTESYWKIARPFSIFPPSISSSGNGTLAVQNMDSSDIYIIKKVELDGVPSIHSMKVSPGETKTLQVSGLPPGEKGGIYEFSVKITYSTPGGMNKDQIGAKKLIGRYT
jgi:hypothetical protein